MPIRLDTPRQSFRRTELSALEKYKIALSSVESTTAVMMLFMSAAAFRKKKQHKKFRTAVRLAALLSSLVEVNSTLASLPKQRSPSCGFFRDPNSFHDSSFFEQFRFRKSHFWMFLQALRWTLADGRPIMIKFGRKGHQNTMRADHILMVFLRRLAFPARWPDINEILGGGRSASSDAYNFALCYFYDKYVPLVQDISRWKHWFARFAARLTQMGAPFDNLISFVDGHFDPTARPMGDGCVKTNVKDYHMYNPLHKGHGIMFQGAVLVNGVAMAWGPFAGNDHDASTVVKASIVEDLKAICDEMGEIYSHFADSAYTQGRYMQAIQKCPPGGALSQSARRFNALMARFRTVVENLFAEVENSWASLQHHHNRRIGRSDVSKEFPCCVLLHNICTLCYGNQTSSYYGLDSLLNLTLSDFLNAGHEFH